ncbi:hypothetical protein F7D13_17245 (plasmid) [Methylocystis rosea]|jgi:hypothetical protein|uniref:Cytochrome b561 bacterial/Ni-hydrogenase domain-containing protein n=1 Tax=Methylocystis rosea TaxID=173366 RepID=A0ABX6EP30_9HYPH|nr:hypothetical protein [Methylocystis rosea]QGM95838.1 hypothetical protein F7D13_17245 [Methylocystis rosea]
MQERERVVIAGLIVLMLILGPGFFVHRSPRFAGSLAGGALGVSAALLMVSPLGYALVKRVAFVRNVVTRKVSLRTLLAWHVYTGIVGPILALLHSGHKFQSLLGMLLTGVMLIVVFTGFVGRYLLKHCSQEIREKRETVSNLQRQYDAAALDLRQQGGPALEVATQGVIARALAGLFLPSTAVVGLGGVTALGAVRLAEAIADVEYSIKMHDVLNGALRRWLNWHLAFSLIFYLLLGVHVWSGLNYGLRWFHP